MQKNNFKGRCQKVKLSKCEDVVRTYSAIQAGYALRLEKEERIKEFQCTVLLEGLEEGDYTSDFVCMTTVGDLMARDRRCRKDYRLLQEGL